MSRQADGERWAVGKVDVEKCLAVVDCHLIGQWEHSDKRQAREVEKISPPQFFFVLAIFGNSVYSQGNLIFKSFPQFFVFTFSIQSIQPNLFLEIGQIFVNSAKKKELHL